MFCPKCGTENKDTAKFCKNCGHPLRVEAAPTRRKRPWLIVVGLLVFIVVSMVAGVVIYVRLRQTGDGPLISAATTRVIEHTFEAAAGTDWDAGIGLNVSVPPAPTEGKVKLVVTRSAPEQLEEEFIALHSVYDVSLASAIDLQERLPVTLTFEIPEGIDPLSAVILEWTEERWALAECKGGLPGGTVSSDGKYISIMREELSRYAVAWWLYEHILRHFENLPEPPPPSPIIEVGEAKPSSLYPGYLVVEVALESPTIWRRLGGTWYEIVVTGEDHVRVEGSGYLAPGERRNLGILFPSTDGHATVCLDTGRALPRAALDWADRLGVPESEMESLLEIVEHFRGRAADWSDLVWAVKELLIKLVWKILGSTLKFYANLVPVSIDIATYINALTDYCPDLCVDVSAEPATPTLTPPPTHPTPKPVLGSKIAFVSNRDGNYEIYLMNADGTGIVRLTENLADDWGPRWSPDGNQIAFTSERDGDPEIYVMNADGTSQVRLTESYMNDSSPVWSPTGRQIAFESDRGRSGSLNFEIYVMNADGTGPMNLTQNPFPAEDRWPSWSSDGKRIAFASSELDGEDFEIYVMNSDGTGVVKLTENTANDGWPTWSPDGKQIAFVSDRDGNFETYVMNADGTGQINLTNNPAKDCFPAWSPDGIQIVFESDRDGNPEIYVMNANGTDQVRLTDNSADDKMPAWTSTSTQALPESREVELPREIETLVFEESNFAKPLTVDLAGGGYWQTVAERREAGYEIRGECSK